MNEMRTDGSPDAKCHLVLAHGAGAPMTSPFLETITRLLIERGLRVSRFEFPYMAARREGGKRRPPPKAERLTDDYRQVVAAFSAEPPRGQALLIGGKSMGGRVASLIADDCFAQGRIAGLVCLGYPFHPIGKPDQLRTSHLENLRCPTLIVQGERDPFGARVEIEDYQLSPSIRFHWAGDGDHDLGPRGGSGYTRSSNLAAAADAVGTFARDLATQK
jgi:predicted alpha/beta-hydrolase family hydrolase